MLQVRSGGPHVARVPERPVKFHSGDFVCKEVNFQLPCPQKKNPFFLLCGGEIGMKCKSLEGNARRESPNGVDHFHRVIDLLTSSLLVCLGFLHSVSHC